MTPDEMERLIFQKTTKELVLYCMELRLLKKARFCGECNSSMKLYNYSRTCDECAWRCMTPKCKNYKKYFSVREYSLFENINVKLIDILRIIIKYSCWTSISIIERSMNISNKTIRKIINKIIELIENPDFQDNKLGGPGYIVQVDETMLNYKCKSHRGRSPNNKTNAICIIEFKDEIRRVFAKVIQDKKQETLIPIICSQVESNSVIWTDEHRSYSCLRNFGFIHDSVCHKFNFKTDEGVNTQAVESFNNCLKYEIKRRKGIITEKRENFLKEFCFYWNNKRNFLDSILNLIKVQLYLFFIFTNIFFFF